MIRETFRDDDRAAVGPEMRQRDSALWKSDADAARQRFVARTTDGSNLKQSIIRQRKGNERVRVAFRAVKHFSLTSRARFYN